MNRKKPSQRVRVTQTVEDERAIKDRKLLLAKRFGEDFVAEVKPMFERVDEPLVQPRVQDDYFRPLCSGLPIPVMDNQGTNPNSGLPNYKPKVIVVDVPREGIRTDAFTEVLAYLDPFELLVFLLDFPGCGTVYRVTPIPALIRQRIEEGRKNPEARKAEEAVKRTMRPAGGAAAAKDFPKLPKPPGRKKKSGLASVEEAEYGEDELDTLSDEELRDVIASEQDEEFEEEEEEETLEV